MAIQAIAYIVISIIASIVSVIVAVFSWRRRPANGAEPLAIMMMCVCLWTLASTFHSMGNNYLFKMFWFYFKYIPIVIMPVAMLVLSIRYNKLDHLITTRNIVLLSIIPIITLIAAFTNEFHHLFLKNIRIIYKGSMYVFASDREIFFWIHTYYSYAITIIGTILFMASIFHLSNIYRKQAIMIIIGAFVPLFANIISIFKIIELPYSDITPLALFLSGLIYFWALFRYKLLYIIPIAREAIIDDMKEILIVLNSGKLIIDMNTIAKTTFLTEKTTFLGQPYDKVLSEYTGIINKINNYDGKKDKIIIYKNGMQTYYDLEISKLYDKKGLFFGQVLLMRDITVLELALKDLMESRKIAEKANEAKSRFLAIMSHEIRTPMNAIIGMAELLENTELNDEQREYLEMIKISSESLLSILNDILDFTKIESGKLEIDYIDFNIRELLANMIKPYKVMAYKKDILLEINIEQDVPHMLVGDPVRVRQILINLINNAMKFTTSGEISINLSVHQVVDKTYMLCFEVTDSGIGIPQDKIVSLFESFRQLDSSTARMYGGTGLGLSIVKNLVFLMKGDIKVESNLGIGSRFIINIPFEISETLFKDKEKQSINISEKQKKLNILVAEDNKVNQVLLIKMLGKFGYHADTADNGENVLEMIKNKKYDLILMDCQMPELDGYQTTTAIREREKNEHIIIIAITANAMKGDKEKCLECGMNDYMSKPIRSKELFNMIQNYF